MMSYLLMTVIVLIIILIVIYNFPKEKLDSLPDASTMIFGVLPASKTVSTALAARGWNR